MRPRCWAFVVAALALLSLAGSSAVTSGAAGPKKQPNLLPYRLSAHFRATYRMEAQGDGVTGSVDVDVGFLGKSERFWLRRGGTSSKPVYSFGQFGAPKVVRMSAPLAYAGTGHWYYPAVPDSAAPPCSVDATFTLGGNGQADVNISLIGNRLWATISSRATVNQHDASSCPGLDRDSTCAPSENCLPLQGFSQTLTAQNVKYIGQSFGHAFGFTRQRDYQDDPSLHRAFASGDQYWTYTWKLTFTPD